MTELLIVNQFPTVPTFKNKTLNDATERVFKIGAAMRQCAFATAYIMAQVDASECYKDDGFNSVHEWAMKTFGFKKSASYTLLRVGKEYTRAIPDAKGKVKGYGSNLIPENSDNDFSTTQIEKMLPGGHELAKELVEDGEITPDMTCKEIERVIKSYTSKDEQDEQGVYDNETVKAEVGEPDGEAVESVEHFVIVTDEVGNRYNVPFEVLEQYKI